MELSDLVKKTGGILLAASISTFMGCRTPLIEHFHEVSNITYLHEGTNDYWQTPEETLERQTGDCEDMALLLQKKLKEDDYNADLVFGYLRVGESNGHAWVESVINGEKYILDPSAGQILKKSMTTDDVYKFLFSSTTLKKYKEYREKAKEKYALNPIYDILEKTLERLKYDDGFTVFEE
jgi:transglutaminase-like putative cysteine protease